MNDDFEELRTKEIPRLDYGETWRLYYEDNRFGEFEKRAMADHLRRIAGNSPEISIFREI